jgi:fatty-acyl-CoA synthase
MLSRKGMAPARDLPIGRLLSNSARRDPHKVALVFESEQRTYRDLDRRSDQLAFALGQRGVGRGDRVALVLHNGLELVEALFACAKLGAVSVPVNFRLVAEEIAYILEDSAAAGVLSGAGLSEVAAEAAAGVQAVRLHLATTGIAGAEDYEAALRDAPPQPLVAPRDDDVAMLLYTSGTTGRPKGAMLTHRSVVLTTLSWIAEMQASARDVWLSGQPLFHIGGINGLLPFVTLGATAVITPSTGFDAQHMLDLLERHAVTMCIFVPTQWDQICKHPNTADVDLGRLRVAMWSASPAKRDTLERLSQTFPEAAIVSAYGQTEMAGATTLLKGDDALRKMGSVGRPMLGIDLRIMDDDGSEVEPGEVGEVVYQGPTIMAGYHARPEATAEAFAGGWFHSGDLARLDDEGYLWLVDRKKDLIVSGGENVYPAEIERVLREHPAVADVAVVGVAHPRWGETPLAFIVAAGEVVMDDLREHCRRRLASYKKPSDYVVVDELPRNAAGKVLKRLLRDAHLTKGEALP